MKLLVLLTTCAFLFSATSEFSVEGMMCGKGCVNKIKKHVGSLDGVKNCNVNFEKALMTVEYDESKLNDKLIMKRLTENTTYSCKPKKQCASSSCSKQCAKSCNKKAEPKTGFFQKILGWF